MELRHPNGPKPLDSVEAKASESGERAPQSHKLGPLGVIGALLVFCPFVAIAQNQPFNVRPLTLHQTRYRLRAGEPAKIDAPPETVDFILHAITRRVEIGGQEARGIVVGPNLKGDQVFLAASLVMRPQEYHVEISATSEAGEVRTTALVVTLDALQSVPVAATQPPVVLLNGWQIGISNGGCPISTGPSDTFGNLPLSLSTPNVYFFDNCVQCPNCLIEDLGNDLGTFLGMIRYDNGQSVPQIDLVTHSMGGLIVRAYLAGLQSNGTLSPPQNPRVRKVVLIAEPNFGSYKATGLLGSQTAEMIPGSAFLWKLATWNQLGDDLRGVGALAVIGNAGSGNGQGSGDGIVSLTSGSLAFTRDPSSTRILPYCHIDTSLLANPILGTMDCSGSGIAKAPETAQIVVSFLMDTSSWMSIGGTPATDRYLSQYGGLYFAVEAANGQSYLNDLSSVLFGNVGLSAGGARNSVFYSEFIAGTGTFQATSTSLGRVTYGPMTVTPGHYTTFRAKLSPAIFGVTPVLANAPGWVVQSGATVTIAGAGFGAQQCGGCRVTASNPQSTALQVSSWSDTSIRAFLPASFVGIAQIGVTTVTGSDAINIMAAPASSIAVSPSSLQFLYTAGGTTPAAQSIQITNSGGTLNWSATTSAPWLSIASQSGTVPSALSVFVSPTGLGAGRYAGSVQISAAGASNSPVSVNVTLTVLPAPAVLALSPQTLTFNYTVGSTLPVGQGVSITNKGGGTLSWTASANAAWVVLSPVSGTGPGTISVSVNPATLATGQYSATIQIAATGASNSPQTASVTLTITTPSTLPIITSVVNGASFQPGIESGSWVSIVGTNLASNTRTWQTSDFTGDTLPLSLDGASVTINGKSAAVYYISPTQLNVQAPTDATTGTVPVVVTNNGQMSAAFTAQLQTYGPAFFLYAGTPYPIAQHYPDNALVGNPSLIPGTIATKPGDVLTLWATGFGPTNPPTPAGIKVSGAPGVATLAAVTVGGVPATVISTVLSPGSAGLYQVAIQVPASVPTGTVALEASVGGVQSPSDIVLFVSAR